jgi:hypothetical protein
MKFMERKEGWFIRNWYGIVHYGARYLTILAFFIFALSLILFWVGGFETLMGIKLAVIIWFVTQILRALKGLK